MGNACTADISDTRDTVHYRGYTADSSQRGRARWKVAKRSLQARNPTPNSQKTPQQLPHLNPLVLKQTTGASRKNAPTHEGPRLGAKPKRASVSVGNPVTLMGCRAAKQFNTINAEPLFSEPAAGQSTFSPSELAVVTPAVASDAFE